MKRNVSASVAGVILVMMIVSSGAPAAVKYEPPIISVPRISSAPTIDGQVLPGEWKGATSFTGLIGTVSAELTRRPQPALYLARDDSNLYFAFVAPFRNPLKMDATSTSGKSVFQDDSFEVFLDPGRTKSKGSCYHFIFGAGGVMGDKGPVGLGYWKWNSGTKYRMTAKNGLWMGEVAIPLAKLGPKITDGQVWGFNICRNYRRPREYTSIAYVGRAYFNPKAFGTLIFKADTPSVQAKHRIVESSFGQVIVSLDVASPADRKSICKFLLIEGDDTVVDDSRSLSLKRNASRKVTFTKTIKPKDEPKLCIFRVSLQDEKGKPYFRQDVPYTPVGLQGGYSYLQKSFVTELSYNTTKKVNASVRLQVFDPAGKAVINEKRLALVEFPPSSGRWHLPQTFLAAQLNIPGDYRLQVIVVDEKDTVLAESTATIPFKQPEWLGNKIGITDRVLPPYTPCEVKQLDGAYEVHTWGRKYVFASLPFLKEIESAKSQILTGPVRFVAVTDSGEKLKWSKSIPELRKSTPAEVRLHQELSGEETSLTIDTQIEYDGFIKVDWALKAKKNIGLKRLVVEFPLNPQQAKMFYSYRCDREGTSGIINSMVFEKNWASPFCPIVLIGNEDTSLCWVAESDQNWFLSDSDKAIEIVKGAGELTLRLNLVTKHIKLKKDRKLNYTFGLQATPVRPVKKTCWDTRFVRCPPYGRESKWLTRKVNDKPVLQYYSEQGARRLLVSRLWDAFSYPLPLGHEKRFKKLVEACHQNNLKVLPYVVGFLLSEVAPESKYYRDDMIVHPKAEYYLRTNRVPGLKGQMNHIVCPQSGLWRDFCAHGIDRCMAEYDIDGIYLDSTTHLRYCKNRLHGCGYERPDGTIGGTYPVFATRQFMKRLYTVVKSRKPDGIVDLHVYGCLNIPGMAFADSYWIGEQMRGVKVDSFPLHRFRLEFMGHNLGVPAELLYYVLRNYEACVGLGLIHDVPVRSENEKDLSIQSVVWSIRDKFECKKAKFIGYWKSKPFVEATSENCYVSLWRHPTNGVLAAVCNLKKKPAEVCVQFNLSKLGFTSNVLAEDVRHKKTLKIENGKLSLSLKPQEWTLIQLRSAGSNQKP